MDILIKLIVVIVILAVVQMLIAYLDILMMGKRSTTSEEILAEFNKTRHP